MDFFAAINSFQSRTEQLKHSHQDSVHLGILDNLATDDQCPLHEALSWFYGTYQSVEPTSLTIEVLSPETIEKGLINRSLDIGVGIFDQHNSGLVYEPLYRERDVLVCRPDHHLASKTDPKERGRMKKRWSGILCKSVSSPLLQRTTPVSWLPYAMWRRQH
jgi:DNA-binding transcriptional LysR family regulator